MTLEKKLSRLEAIVAELESDKLDLAAALALFEEGVGCLREAAVSLSDAEVRVTRLRELADGAFVLEAMDPDE